MSDELTAKQALFVAAYTGRALGNATQAARLAGYVGNDETLAAVGYENLRKPYIAEAIQARLAELAMPDDEILARLSEQARGDIGEILSVSGRGIRLDLKKAKETGASRLVKKYAKTDRGVSVELYSAQEALSILASIRGLKQTNVNLRLANMSDEQIAERAREIAARLARGAGDPPGSGEAGDPDRPGD